MYVNLLLIEFICALTTVTNA